MVRTYLFYPLLALLLCGIIHNPLVLAQGEKTEQVQEISSQDWHANPEAYPILERTVNVLNARILRKHSILIIIDHRLHETFTNNAFYDFLGFDGGLLKIGLGLRLGLFNNLEIGAYRLNGSVERFDTYEFDCRYGLLNQHNGPLDLAVRAGVTWFSQQHAKDASGFLAQLLVNRAIGKYLTLGTGFLYHSESSNDAKSNIDDKFSIAIPISLEARLFGPMAIVLEAVQNVGGYGSARPAASAALKFITNRHSFSILISNTQYITADGIVTNSWRGFKDLILGFLITRELQF